MSLREYLRGKGRGAVGHLAAQLGVKPSQVSGWAKEGVCVSPRYALLIEEATGGQVPVEETCPGLRWDVVRGKASTYRPTPVWRIWSRWFTRRASYVS